MAILSHMVSLSAFAAVGSGSTCIHCHWFFFNGMYSGFHFLAGAFHYFYLLAFIGISAVFDSFHLPGLQVTAFTASETSEPLFTFHFHPLPSFTAAFVSDLISLAAAADACFFFYSCFVVSFASSFTAVLVAFASSLTAVLVVFASSFTAGLFDTFASVLASVFCFSFCSSFKLIGIYRIPHFIEPS